MVPSLKAFGLAEFSEGQKNTGRSSPIQLGVDSPKSSSAQQPGRSEQSAPRRPGPAVSSVVLCQEGCAA